MADAALPAQAGRRMLLTGGTSGIGYEAARALAAAGAEVTLAARDLDKAARAIHAIRRAHPEARLEARLLDTASLASVRAFAAGCDGGRPIDRLILNAGVAWLPRREVTVDGFERQFATNYLGHFALTGLMLPHLARDARIVPTASLAHRRGRLNLDDLQSARGYDGATAYRQSKLAMLLFGCSLDQRLQAAGMTARAIPVHPGWARTGIFRRGEQASLVQRIAGHAAFGLLGQSAAAGARPILYAANAPEARGGVYYGPDGAGERRGAPTVAQIAPHARDTVAAERLWSASEALTGIRYLS